jgi:hypothetical protein
MSIDSRIFVELLGELEAYYKRELTPFAKRVWYKHLSEKLTNDEFYAAVESAIVSRQFMPSPQELVEVIKGDDQTNALHEWEMCVLAAARNDREIVSRLSAQGQSALHLVGGLHKLGMATEEQLVWIKKEFIGVWKTTRAEVKSLPASNNSEPIQMDAVRELSQKMSFTGNSKWG